MKRLERLARNRDAMWVAWTTGYLLWAVLITVLMETETVRGFFDAEQGALEAGIIWIALVMIGNWAWVGVTHYRIRFLQDKLEELRKLKLHMSDLAMIAAFISAKDTRAGWVAVGTSEDDTPEELAAYKRLFMATDTTLELLRDGVDTIHQYTEQIKQLENDLELKFVVTTGDKTTMKNYLYPLIVGLIAGVILYGLGLYGAAGLAWGAGGIAAFILAVADKGDDDTPRSGGGDGNGGGSMNNPGFHQGPDPR